MRSCIAFVLVGCSLAFVVQNVVAQEGAHGADAHASEDHAEGHDLGHGNAGAQFEDPSEFKSDLAIYTFVVFLLLMMILGKFAWPVINEALIEREKRIAENIAAAEAMHEKAKSLLAGYEAKLAGAADQVREMLEEARRDGEHTKSQIVAEAKAATEAEKDRALREVRNAKESALKEIGETIANFAVELAAKIVEREVSEKDHANLIRAAVSKFPEAEPSNN